MPRPGRPFSPLFAALCALAASGFYAIGGWGALVPAAFCLSVCAALQGRRPGELRSLSLPAGCAVALFLLPVVLAGSLFLGFGLVAGLASLIVMPRQSFLVLLGLGLVYAGQRVWAGGSGRRRRAAAALLVLCGLALSPPAWQGLRAESDRRFPVLEDQLGWRFRISGPESRAAGPRFYVAGASGKLEPVTVCPPGTRQAQKMAGDGWLCR